MSSITAAARQRHEELLAWRLAGAAVWHGVAHAGGLAAWCFLARPLLGRSLAPRPPGLLTTCLLAVLQLAVLLAHRALLAAAEAPPVYLPLLGLHGRSWPGLLVSRVLLRARRPGRDLLAVASLFTTTCASAAATLALLPPSAPDGSALISLDFCAGYGLVLGALYTVQHLGRCRDVLSFPAIHRHRWWVLRQRLPRCVGPALRAAATAEVLALAAGYRPGSWVALLPALHAGGAALWGWLAAHAALEVVMTEPLALASVAPLLANSGGGQGVDQPRDDAGPVPALLDALADPDPLIQELAVSELADLAQGRTPGHAAWRRAGVWGDSPDGQGSRAAAWPALAGIAVAELRDWAATVSAGLGGGGGGGAGAGIPAGIAWNVLGAAKAAAAAAPAAGGASRAADLAAWSVRARGHRVASCMRALSGLAAAARSEDRYGTVLMSDPVLGDVMVALLSALLAAQAFAKSPVAAASRSSQVARAVRQVLDAALGPAPHPSLAGKVPSSGASALEDVARCAAYQVVCAYGPALQAALQDAKLSKPPHGSSGDVAALLAGMLAYKE